MLRKTEMKVRNVVLPIILVISLIFLPTAYAEPTVTITMEKTTYSYCEKLFYTIEVSEVTNEYAFLHIRDETGKGSDAIPIRIEPNGITPVPSPYAFEKEIFPLGKYFIDVEYSGANVTAEFNLIDSDNICMPGVIKQFMIEWLNEKMSDGHLIDAFQKYIDVELIDIPFEINDENIFKIDIPDWVKNIGYWWVQGIISDEDFAQAISYLIDENIISPTIGIENKI